MNAPILPMLRLWKTRRLAKTFLSMRAIRVTFVQDEQARSCCITLKGTGLNFRWRFSAVQGAMRSAYLQAENEEVNN